MLVHFMFVKGRTNPSFKNNHLVTLFSFYFPMGAHWAPPALLLGACSSLSSFFMWLLRFILSWFISKSAKPPLDELDSALLHSSTNS